MFTLNFHARRKTGKLAILAAVTGLTSFGSASLAATFTWDEGAAPDFSWNNATNWTANSGTPVPGDTANWSGGSTPSPATVTLTQNEAADAINVNDKVVTFNLNNFTLTTTAQSNFDGDTSNAIFSGPGTATFGGLMRLGFDNVAVGPSPSPSTHATVTASNGAQVNTNAGTTLGDYRTGGIVKVMDNGTVWNSAGHFQFVRGSSGYRTYAQPRAQLLITGGAVFNHFLGTNSGNQGLFTIARGSNRDSYIQVDGAGSQMNITGSYGTFWVGGYTSAVTFDITNGGVFTAASDIGLSARNETVNPKVNTVNISGANSRFAANTITLAGRNGSDVSRGTTVVNVGTGGLLEATGFDGGDRGIIVGDRGLLSLQGGSAAAPATKTITLATGSVAGTKSTLEGFGTISSGNLVAQQDSRVRPGISGAGTIRITSGDLTTAAGATPTELLFELNTTSGNPHDMIGLNALSSTATIGDNSTSAITFSVLGGGTLAAGADGFMDFLIGGTVNYGATPLLDDVPNIDNLDDLLAAAGYTRVDAAVTPGANEYRYFLATVGAGDYAGEFAGQQALRLEFASVPIPEPASLAVLGLGAVAMLRRRRS